VGFYHSPISNTYISTVTFRTTNYVRHSFWMLICLLLFLFCPYSVIFFVNIATIITFVHLFKSLDFSHKLGTPSMLQIKPLESAENPIQILINV